VRTRLSSSPVFACRGAQDPPTIAVSICRNARAEDGKKDTLANIDATGEPKASDEFDAHEKSAREEESTNVTAVTAATAFAGEFVVCIMSEWFVESANHTCGNFPRGSDVLPSLLQSLQSLQSLHPCTEPVQPLLSAQPVQA